MRHLTTTLMLGMILVAVLSANMSKLSASEQLLSMPAQSLDTCLVELTGDVNLSGTITSGDIIYVVNWVFLRGPRPLPCSAAGDVSCSGMVSSTDVIVLVNYVFKSGMPPCDVCSIIHTLWSLDWKCHNLP